MKHVKLYEDDDLLKDLKDIGIGGKVGYIVFVADVLFDRDPTVGYYAIIGKNSKDAGIIAYLNVMDGGDIMETYINNPKEFDPDDMMTGGSGIEQIKDFTDYPSVVNDNNPGESDGQYHVKHWWLDLDLMSGKTERGVFMLSPEDPLNPLKVLNDAKKYFVNIENIFRTTKPDSDH